MLMPEKRPNEDIDPLTGVDRRFEVQEDRLTAGHLLRLPPEVLEDTPLEHPQLLVVAHRTESRVVLHPVLRGLEALVAQDEAGDITISDDDSPFSLFAGSGSLRVRGGLQIVLSSEQALQLYAVARLPDFTTTTSGQASALPTAWALITERLQAL